MGEVTETHPQGGLIGLKGVRGESEPNGLRAGLAEPDLGRRRASGRDSVAPPVCQPHGVGCHPTNGGGGGASLMSLRLPRNCLLYTSDAADEERLV